VGVSSSPARRRRRCLPRRVGGGDGEEEQERQKKGGGGSPWWPRRHVWPSGLLLLVVSWDRVGWLCFGWILGFMEAGEVFGLELRGVGSNECRGGQEAMAGTHYKCTRMLSFIFR
jgi:hypothetical protein